MKLQIIERILYSLGAVESGEAVRSTEYGSFRISGVLIVHKHVNAFGTKQSVHNNIGGRFSGVSIADRMGTYIHRMLLLVVNLLVAYTCMEMY